MLRDVWLRVAYGIDRGPDSAGVLRGFRRFSLPLDFYSV
jgi:hypothetical protein